MAQVLQKSYDCLTCHKQIRIAKIDNAPAGQKKKWDKFELDGLTPHLCSSIIKPKEKEQVFSSSGVDVGNISKEIAAVKAQLLMLVNRLDKLEKELQKKNIHILT